MAASLHICKAERIPEATLFRALSKEDIVTRCQATAQPLYKIISRELLLERLSSDSEDFLAGYSSLVLLGIDCPSLESEASAVMRDLTSSRDRGKPKF